MVPGPEKAYDSVSTRHRAVLLEVLHPSPVPHERHEERTAGGFMTDLVDLASHQPEYLGAESESVG